MKTMRLHRHALIEEHPLRLEEQPLPEPGPGQIRVRVAVCGACRTDLHIVEGEVHPPALPIIPGHQVVGRVDSAGPGVQISIGQRVGIPWLWSACGRCSYCKAGRENLCEQARFTGMHVDGGYAEAMIADARYALPLPEGISDEQAAPLLCAGLVGFRSLRQADILPGERVGLAGFGASAHLCIQVLNHWGCETFVFTRSENHREHARNLGAAWTGGTGDEIPAPLDRAVIFAPSGRIVPAMLEKIRPGGTLAINAIHMSPIPEMPYRTIYGERTLRSVANATYQDGIDFLALAAAIPVQATVQIYPLAEANRALQDMKASRINGEAVLEVDF